MAGRERVGTGGGRVRVGLEERWDPDDLVQNAFAEVLSKHSSDIHDLGPDLRRTIVNLATDERPAMSSDEFPTALVRVFGPDGSELGDDGGLLEGQPLALQADATYTVVVERFYGCAHG